MRPNEMHRIARAGTHLCAPTAWRSVPVLTGDYDMDATILMQRTNKDLHARLNLYLRTGGRAYGPRTGYNGYRGYSGDD